MTAKPPKASSTAHTKNAKSSSPTGAKNIQKIKAASLLHRYNHTSTMTREEAIKRWESIIPTVFRAEQAIRPRLQAVLKEHEDDPTTGAELYISLIAEEIVSKTTDEELQTME